jgi:hypothetical protein
MGQRRLAQAIKHAGAKHRATRHFTCEAHSQAHATGDYPVWWPGRRFEGRTDWWVAGDTRETTRDIIQLELFGSREGIRQGRYSGRHPEQASDATAVGLPDARPENA